VALEKHLKIAQKYHKSLFSTTVLSIVMIFYIRDGEMKEHQVLNISCKHYFMIGVELKYLIGSGYLRIFDGVCQAIKKL
jgi:hypothetical protein